MASLFLAIWMVSFTALQMVARKQTSDHGSYRGISRRIMRWLLSPLQNDHDSQWKWWSPHNALTWLTVLPVHVHLLQKNTIQILILNHILNQIMPRHIIKSPLQSPGLSSNAWCCLPWMILTFNLWYLQALCDLRIRRYCSTNRAQGIKSCHQHYIGHCDMRTLRIWVLPHTLHSHTMCHSSKNHLPKELDTFLKDHGVQIPPPSPPLLPICLLWVLKMKHKQPTIMF